MEYRGDSSQYYHNYSEVKLANSYDKSNNYFASNINSLVDVASCDNIRHVSSAISVDNIPYYTCPNYAYHDKEPMYAENL